VVAAWGSILLMGVTDPLGGINTLFPLFGIANQLLAAIALTVVLVIVVKKGLTKWAWVPGIPLVWDLLVTMTASWQKIFSADPKLGYWKQHSICQAAQDAGKLCLTAKTQDDMTAIVRNTFIQGTLSIVFAVLVLIVAVVGGLVAYRAWRSGETNTTETPEEPSKIFAPSGFVATAAEKEVQKQWDELIATGKVRAPGAAHVHAR
jgi:carbon starvation protein